ncbi:MAG: outer membrane beta-barrel protein [Bacteroidota bacterium]
MKKLIARFALLSTLVLTSLSQIQAQDIVPESNKTKPASFLNADLSLLYFGSSESAFGGNIGYNKYLTPRLSLTGELNYKYTERKFFSSEYYSHTLGLSTGLRYRWFQGRKLSLYGEGRVGLMFERVTNSESVSPRVVDYQYAFAELGLGMEHRISDRLNFNLGLSTRYNGQYGFEPMMRLGLQYKLKK